MRQKNKWNNEVCILIAIVFKPAKLRLGFDFSNSAIYFLIYNLIISSSRAKYLMIAYKKKTVSDFQRLFCTVDKKTKNISLSEFTIYWRQARGKQRITYLTSLCKWLKDLRNIAKRQRTENCIEPWLPTPRRDTVNRRSQKLMTR